VAVAGEVAGVEASDLSLSRAAHSLPNGLTRFACSIRREFFVIYARHSVSIDHTELHL
jgi:hypothetical protein